MTPADSLLLILRRLDEIERKLEHILEELQIPPRSAIQHAVAIVQGRTEAGPIEVGNRPGSLPNRRALGWPGRLSRGLQGLPT
jgi:hypothetical protein